MLVSVVLLLTVLLTLAMLAFNERQVNSTSTSRAQASSQADAIATAGLSAALFDIASGNFQCQMSSQGLLPPGASSPNAGASRYTVDITYYSANWSPGSTPPSSKAIPCSQGVASTTPVAALVSSRGATALARASFTETITGHVAISLAPQNYAAFSASTAALDLSYLQVTQSSGEPEQPQSPQGVIYTNGPVGSSGACGPESATVIASGSSTLNGCNVTGSVELANGTLTLTNNTSVAGNVTSSGGDVVMSDSTVQGDTTASGSVYLCPGKGPEPSGCSNLTPEGPSTISGSALASTGSVVVDGTTVFTESPPCSPYQQAGDTIGGCITSGSNTKVFPPPSVTLPAMGTPSPQAWSAAGYSNYYSTTDCSNVQTSPGKFQTGSVAYYLTNESAATVIYADCTLNLSGLGNINLSYNTAIFATGGISIGGGTSFKPPHGSTTPLQLSLIVPSPPAGYSCSSGSYGLTDSSNTAIPSQINTFFYTPCTFSTTTKLNISGEVIAGTISLSAPLRLAYSPFSPPGLVFGYQVLVQERNITQP